MEYWVIIDNEQRGPLSVEEISRLELDADTPAWHKGLSDWTTVAAIPELARLVKVQQSRTEAQPAAAAVGIIAVPEGAIPPGYVPIMPVQTGRGVLKIPTYMWLSVVLTIFGTIFIGLLSIFFSYKVISNRKKGNTAKAYRWSERAAMVNILNIVFTLISIPFGLVLEMGHFSLF